MEPMYVSIRYAVELSGMGKSWIYKKILDGSLPSVKFGRARRIAVKELADFLERENAAAQHG